MINKHKDTIALIFVLLVLQIFGLNQVFCSQLVHQDFRSSSEEKQMVAIDSLNQLFAINAAKQPEVAKGIALQALEIAGETGDFALIVGSKLNLAIAYRFMRSFEKVLEVLNPVLPHLSRINDKDLIADILNNIGIAHFQLGHDDLSLSKYLESIKEGKSDDNLKSLSESLKNIGNFYLSSKSLTKAYSFYGKSAQVDSLIDDTRNLAVSRYNLGKVAYLQNNFELSDHYLKSSLPYLTDTLKGSALYYQAKMVFDQDLGAAMVFLNSADSILTPFGFTDVKKSVQILKSKGHALMGNYSSAIKGLDLLDNMPAYTTPDLAETYVFIADLMLANKLLLEAKSCYGKAYEISLNGNYHSLQGKALVGLSRYYEQVSNLGQSQLMLKQYAKLADSIKADLVAGIASEQNNRFDFESLERRIEAYKKDTKIQKLELERERTGKRNLIILVIILIPLLVVILLLYRSRIITNIKLSEKNKQINQQNEELSAINDQLELSKQKLVQLNITKDKFFSIVAHDLKSPLISLRSLLFSINTNEAANSNSFRPLVEVENSLNTVIDLLNNLLFWALSQDDSIKYQPVKFSLNEVIDSDYSIAYRVASEKNVKFDLYTPNALEIFTDMNMFLFIFRNLVSNAIKFTPPNGKVAVKFKVQNSKMLLTVEDNGKGIESHRLDQIFDFSGKSDAKHKQEGEGTGLGLSLSKEFAHKMGGTLTVDSEIDKGSRFHLTIPID